MVWPSPFQMDLVEFGLSRRVLQSFSRLALPELLISGSLMPKKAIDDWRVRHVVGGRCPQPDWSAIRWPTAMRVIGPGFANPGNVVSS